MDPLGGQSQNNSPYVYVLNNPMVLIDPSGMSPKGAKETAEDTEAWNNYYSEQEGTKHLNQVVASYKEQESKATNLESASGGEPRTVHVLALPGANLNLIKAAIEELKRCATNAGLNVTFELTTPDKFDITKMPLTDAVAVVGGTNRETADFIFNSILG